MHVSLLSLCGGVRRFSTCSVSSRSLHSYLQQLETNARGTSLEQHIKDLPIPLGQLGIFHQKQQSPLDSHQSSVSSSSSLSPSSPYVVGICGGIASGKSSIAKKLCSLGSPLLSLPSVLPVSNVTPTSVHIDADMVGHHIYQPGKPAYFMLIKEFGEDILDKTAPNQPIDRKKLGARVFSGQTTTSPAEGGSTALQRLNNIVWPAIRKEVMQTINTYSKYDLVIIEAFGLLDAQWDKTPGLVHEVWSTTIPTSVALQRLIERNNLTEEEAKRRMMAQKMTDIQRAERSNIVLTTLFQENETIELVKHCWLDLAARQAKWINNLQ